VAHHLEAGGGAVGVDRRAQHELYRVVLEEGPGIGDGARVGVRLREDAGEPGRDRPAVRSVRLAERDHSRAGGHHGVGHAEDVAMVEANRGDADRGAFGEANRGDADRGA
jgi:hypothetical protein